MMTSQEKDFLIAEYKSAWDTVIGIDNRRASFASYFAVIFVGALSVFAVVIKGGVNFETKIALTLLLLGALSTGALVVAILRSERAANMRYRLKANAIRDIIIGKTDDSRILNEYLNRDDLASVVPLAGHKVSATGQTLSSIRVIVVFQLMALCGAIFWLWRWV